MIDMLIENLPAILTALAAVGFVRAYMKKILTLVTEVKELEAAIVKAMEDKKLTEEELQNIMKEAKDIPGALSGCLDPIKKLWNKIFRR